MDPTHPMPLLRTKLHPPLLRQPVVRRPRLVALLDTGLTEAITLISAPAGFGKTTALAEWASQASRNGISIAWLSLDRDDNDPGRFITYFLAALKEIDGLSAELEDVLQSTQPIPIRSVLERLLSDLETRPAPLVILLDDYHLISAQPIHEALIFLLDHLPPQVHLFLATRADPPIPLARLRAKREMIEIRAEDLRFTAEEAAEFLNGLMGLSLSVDSLESIEKRTEGWIAGLQMAAIAMQGRTDREAFIQAFSGSHRFVLEYLVEEVLNRQPEPAQEFLLRTSILERLTGPLCDALTGQSGGHSMLEGLARANLFLTHLDDERRWYRYHPLFADLLQAQLLLSQPELVPSMHLRAAEWFDQHGYPVEAVQHAFASGDLEKAADLIELHGPERWSFSDITFLSLAARLPEAITTTRPKLGIFQAWIYLLYGQFQTADRILKALAGSISIGEESSDSRGISSFYDLLVAYIAAVTGQDSQIQLPDRRSLSFVPERQLGMRNTADVIYAMMLAWKGDFEDIPEILINTVRRDLEANGTTAIPISISLLAHIRKIQGRLHEAARLCREYLQIVNDRGKWKFYIAGNLNITLGEILLEWNDLEASEEQIREGLQSNEAWNIPTSKVIGMLALARLQVARADPGSAQQTLERLEGLILGKTIHPEQLCESRALKAKLGRLAGRPIPVSDILGELGDRQPPGYLRELDEITLARELIADRAYSEALPLLDRIAESNHLGGRFGRFLEVSLLRALALYGSGHSQAAFDALADCLEIAEPEGYMRTFLDAGEPGQALLRAYLRSPASRQRAYAQKLLAAFSLAAPADVTLTGPALADFTKASPEGLIEPLSPREIEVLRLICEGSSNTDIAQTLFISMNTVKKHTGNILGKLGVQNRAQAIVRARQLGLFEGEL